MISVETYLEENIKYLLYYLDINLNIIYLSLILKFQFSCNLSKYFCLCFRSYLNTLNTIFYVPSICTNFVWVVAVHRQ